MTTTEGHFELLQAEAYRARYLADQIETATPEQRLLMLFDKLLRDLDDAAEGLAHRLIEQTSEALVHAQEILYALRDPLDRETALGAALAGTYTFCLNRLVQANLTKDAVHLRGVREMIEAIANANRQAAASLAVRGSTGVFEGVA
ncbi:MAG TPA: flagellar export chaperone FliS [Acidimicrobiales bacterium]|nr:flagellar export chaperone FliS [Acidimicrobiales bacterium]